MNTIGLIAIGVIILIVAIALIIVGMRQSSDADPLADRLAEYASEADIQANLEEIEMSVPFTERVLIPLATQLARLTSAFTPAETLEKTQRKLDLAGNPSNLTPAIFWVMRFGAMGGMALLLLVVFSISNQKPLFVILGVVGGGIAGFMLPQMWLSNKISKRQNEILKSLPDALDLMSICVNAGLGFDQAMGKVYEKWENELALAFGRVMQEIQIGKTRRDALHAMAETMDVPDVTTFVGAIIQADQLGVSISRVLTIQADQMRIKRRQRAQEKAQQAPIKMMIPMVIFIFPSIWIVLLGPAGVQLFKAFFR
jgi:tight adherence protein C